MSKTMLAARIPEWGSVTLHDVPRPRVQPGETLIRVDAARVSYLDLTVMNGEFDPAPPLPHTLGADGRGRVESSESFVPGTGVLVRGGGVGIGRAGTWAEFVSVPDEAVFAVPNLPAPVAATFLGPTSTAWVAVHDMGRVGADDTVVVVGAAGAVGRSVAELSLRAGARVVGVVRRNDDRHRLPAEVEVVSSDSSDRLAVLTRERPATLLVDTVGGPELKTRMGWVAPGRQAIVLGYVGGVTAPINVVDFIGQDVTLLPLNMMRWQHVVVDRFTDLVGLVEKGILDADVEINCFALHDVENAIEALRNGGGRRIVLTPSSE